MSVSHPVAIFNTLGSNACIGVPFTFFSSSTGNSLKYLWNFGDGGTSTASSPSHAYAAVGTYTVRLIVTDNVGCKDTMTKPSYINVNGRPHADFDMDDTINVCPPLIVNFTNKSTGAVRYAWSFGTGASSGGGGGTITLTGGWTSRDIGSVGAAGTASVSNGTFTVKGSGADVWGSADEFRFVYKQLTGDGSITARVSSVTNQNAWSKAGVMMRETLTAGSKHATMFVSAGKGLAFQRRTSTNGSSLSTAGAASGAPYWVRITRSGATFTAYQSIDGSNWTPIGSATMNMTATIYVGLAVTSHADGNLTTGTFTNVQ
jgi:regulation of enolase protein 1 (concanavalin A-like superfamily)